MIIEKTRKYHDSVSGVDKVEVLQFCSADEYPDYDPKNPEADPRLIEIEGEKGLWIFKGGSNVAYDVKSIQRASGVRTVDTFEPFPKAKGVVPDEMKHLETPQDVQDQFPAVDIETFADVGGEYDLRNYDPYSLPLRKGVTLID